ncbi:MAG: hypothetical protein AAGB19_02560 [Cyanobacteria bacterium P01_F01_bin.3]
MTLPFDAAATQARVDAFWQRTASFGTERNAYHNYLNELVSDRYTLTKGLQILRDELQFAAHSKTEMDTCGADLTLPSVVTTLAYTNCGDRIHQGEVTKRYRDVVASRFGKVRIQGLGTQAECYGGRLVEHAAEKRLQLRYGDWDNVDLPIEEITYKVKASGL